MPIFFRASVFQPIARTRGASVDRGIATVPGVTPNGNTRIILGSTLNTSTVLRNIENIFNPLSADVLWYGYGDDVDLTLTGFPLEPSASIAIEANRDVYVKVGGLNPIHWAADAGSE
jgi:hypothetical protein